MISQFVNKILNGDTMEIIKKFPGESIDCVITSPPYWALRDYGIYEQLGIESTFQEYLDKLINIFSEIKRILKADGTLWINLGDVYNGNKKGKTDKKVSNYLKTHSNHINKKKNPNLELKSLCQIPSRFSIRMTDQLGFILRNEIIWHKPNAMPSSATDRFTVDFEKIFFFTKNKKYYFKQQFEPYKKPLDRWGGDKLKANGKSSWDDGTGQKTYRKRNMRPNKAGKNKRSVWSINTRPFPDAHFAVYPLELIMPCILAGCPPNGIVLDPFMGAGTTALAAKKLGRKYIGIELNAKYVKMANKRLDN